MKWNVSKRTLLWINVIYISIESSHVQHQKYHFKGRSTKSPFIPHSISFMGTKGKQSTRSMTFYWYSLMAVVWWVSLSNLSSPIRKQSDRRTWRVGPSIGHSIIHSSYAFQSCKAPSCITDWQKVSSNSASALKDNYEWQQYAVSNQIHTRSPVEYADTVNAFWAAPWRS